MLSDVSRLPADIKSAVILLHGYGANGQDLISLSDFWQHALPQTAFFAPNAPYALDYDSYEWFSLNDYRPDEAANESYALKLMHRAKPVVSLVTEYIHHICITHHLSPDKIVLGGFSQGGLMTFLSAFSFPQPLAGIMGLSAVPLAEPQKTSFRLPVLLTHGTADFVVPFEAMHKSQETLAQMGQSVETFSVPYMGHGIDENCIHKIGQFLFSVLKEKN